VVAFIKAVIDIRTGICRLAGFLGLLQAFRDSLGFGSLVLLGFVVLYGVVFHMQKMPRERVAREPSRLLPVGGHFVHKLQSSCPLLVDLRD
jgi:hypothetical protein